MKNIIAFFLFMVAIIIVAVIYQQFDSPPPAGPRLQHVPSSEEPLVDLEESTAEPGPKDAQPSSSPVHLLDPDTLVRELRAIVDEISAENDQLHRKNEALSARLSETLTRLSALESAKTEYYGNDLQPGTEKIFSNEKFGMEKHGEVIYMHDKTGNELFEFDLENERLSFHGGWYLKPLDTILFNAPEFVSNLKSTKGKDKTVLNFENTLPEEMHLFWMDYQGKPKHYRTLRPGEKHTQHTYMTHPWIITDKEGNIHNDIAPLYTNQIEDIIIAE